MMPAYRFGRKDGWLKDPTERHRPHWSGLAGIWRNDREVCLTCGIARGDAAPGHFGGDTAPFTPAMAEAWGAEMKEMPEWGR